MHDVRVVPDHTSFERVARALEDEGDGDELRDDLADHFRDILEDLVQVQRSGLMSLGSGGLQHAGEPLRTAIADRMTVDVRISAKSGGARIRARKVGMPRGFHNAPKRVNSHQWRHKVFGRDVWVTQISSAEGWFDDPIEAGAPRFRAAARRCLDNVADRIDRKT